MPTKFAKTGEASRVAAAVGIGLALSSAASATRNPEAVDLRLDGDRVLVTQAGSVLDTIVLDGSEAALRLRSLLSGDVATEATMRFADGSNSAAWHQDKRDDASAEESRRQKGSRGS